MRVLLVVVLALAAFCAVDARRSLRAALRSGSMSLAQNKAMANGDSTAPTLGFEGEMEHFKLVYVHGTPKAADAWPINKKSVWTTAGRTGPYDACPLLDITKDMCNGAGQYCTIEAITGCAPAEIGVQKKLVKAMREFFRAVDKKARDVTNADGVDTNAYQKIAKLDEVVAEYHKNVPTEMRLVLNPKFASNHPAVPSGDLYIAIEDKPDSTTGVQVNFALKLARYAENRNNEITKLFTSDLGGVFGQVHYNTMRACAASYLAADNNSPLYAHRDDLHLKGFFTVLGIYYAVQAIDPPGGGLVGRKNAWGLLVKNPLSDILRFVPDTNSLKAHVLAWFNGLAGPKAQTFTNAFFDNACLQRYGPKDNGYLAGVRTTIETAMTPNQEFENIFQAGNTRFAGGETGTAYGNAYANAASPDMKTAKNTQGRKQTHTDNPLPMMKINGEPALVVELRSGDHALKGGSTIKRKDVKCGFFSLKKKCRSFDYDEEGLQGALDLITAANA